MSVKPVSVEEAQEWLALGIEDFVDPAGESLVAGSMASLIGLDDVSRIGSGSGGTVYRAREMDTDRQVALKVFGGDVSSGEEFQRFRQEARILAAVQHPSIAAIRRNGTIECGGRLIAYIVMDYVGGPDLGEWCASPGRSIAERLTMMASIAEAVEHAHRHGVIHRDLKPSNIRISPEGQPIVLDFGIAHVANPDARVTGLETATGRFLGTPAYMAPEQIGAPSAIVDTRFDVYALGVMTFESLAGVLPIQVSGLPLLRAIEVIRESRPPRLGAFDAAFRGDAEAVVDRALAKSSDDRYRSAGDLAIDLRRLVAGEPVSARLPGPMTELMRLARRYRRTTIIVLLVFVTLVVAMIATLDALQRARRANETATAGWTRWLDFASALGNVEVSTETRRAFASFVGGWSESFAAESTLDDDRKRLVARTLDVMSDIELAGGERDATLEHRLRALDLRRELVDAAPKDLDSLRQLSRAIVKVGDLYKEGGDFERASELYRENRAIDERLLDLWPECPDVLDDWCWTLIRQIDLHRQVRDMERARIDFELLEPAVRRLVALDTGRKTSLFTLASVLAFIADIEQRSNAGVESVDRVLDEALIVTERLVRDYPDDSSCRRVREKTLVFAARADMASGRQRSGEARLDEAALIAGERMRAEPTSSMSWAIMADIVREMVQHYDSDGEIHRPHYMAALRALLVLDREMLRLDPDSASHRHLVAVDAYQMFDAEGQDRESSALAVDLMIRSIENSRPDDPADAVSRLLAARAFILDGAGESRDAGRARMLCDAALSLLESTTGMTPELYEVAAKAFEAMGDDSAATAARERARNRR